MSRLICANAIDGAVRWVARAEATLDDATQAKGENAAVGFGNTAYFLPIIYSLTEEKVERLGDCRRILKRARALIPERPSDQTWLPYLGNTLDAGVAALFACEIIEACKCLIGPDPVQGKGTDLQRIGEQLRGKMCTWGGINGFITVEMGTKTDIDAAVREAIAALGPEGFILSPVDNIRDPSDETWENVLALIESWKKHRG